MGMFDSCIPDPPLKCPVCGALLPDWQGKDGGCGLFVWRQGFATPVDQAVSEDVRLTETELASRRLPNRFEIRSYDCDCPFPVEATGSCVDGVWVRTEVVTAATARQKPEERRGPFKARLRWLSGKRD